MTKISVIIPVYNSEEYIENAINHLKNQKFTDFEVIVVDDCSTDSTIEILEKSSHNLDLKIIKLEKNSGPGFARNRGIAISKGEFICFCDSDDYYSEEYLFEMYNSSLINKSDLVICDTYLHFKNGEKKLVGYTNNLLKNQTKIDFLIHSKQGLCKFLIKRDLFNNLLIPNIYNGEDAAIVPILIMKSKKISVVNKGLYNYCIRENSLSNKVTKSSYLNLLHSQKIIEDNIRKSKEVEFIGIKGVLYAAVLVGIKAKVNKKDIIKVINEFNIKYENWYNNEYMKFLSINYKVFLFFVRQKFLFPLKLYSIFHSHFFKK